MPARISTRTHYSVFSCVNKVRVMAQNCKYTITCIQVIWFRRVTDRRRSCRARFHRSRMPQLCFSPLRCRQCEFVSISIRFYCHQAIYASSMSNIILQMLSIINASFSKNKVIYTVYLLVYQYTQQTFINTTFFNCH